VVVGENLKRLREQRGWTQQELASNLRANGLHWTRHQVAAAEIGRRDDIGVSELALLVHTLDVPAGDLFAGAGQMRLSPEASLDRAKFWPLLMGDVTVRVLIEGLPAETATARLAGVADADHRLAERLSIPVETVLAAAEDRWGHSLTEERDRRVIELGDDGGDRRARRGHITRQLGAELEQEISTKEE
jgi:transcriptional regulator with XRE-family HTH domain